MDSKWEEEGAKKKSSLNLKQVLKDFVVSRVTVPDDDRKRNVEIVRGVVEQRLINYMKQDDELFNALYRNIFYAGSYYEGLKVTDANEFDLNIRLKLPFKEADIEIIHDDRLPGFVQYKLSRPLDVLLLNYPNKATYAKLSKILDYDDDNDDDTCTYLSQFKLRKWMQSIVDKALNSHRNDFMNVKRSVHGPATTLDIVVPSDGSVLNVDLVPVVQLTKYPLVVRDTGSLRDIPLDKKTCFIVPKPPPISLDHHDHFFRVSIPDAEKLLMKHKGCVKMIIKIFKVIRDIEKWSFLCSYYIKTVFFWELENNPNSEDWAEKKLDELFLIMIQKFILVMKDKYLRHIFFPEYNLLSTVHSSCTFDNCKGRLETIKKWSGEDLPKLKKYFQSHAKNQRRDIINAFVPEDQTRQDESQSNHGWFTSFLQGLTGWFFSQRETASS